MSDEKVLRVSTKERPLIISDPEKSKTKQSMKNDCDINVIMKRYISKGVLPQLIAKDPVYGDFSNVPDYQEALNILDRAQKQFMAIPADARKRFDNDPVKFLEFASDPKNKKEMQDMGLIAKDVEPIPPIEKPVVNPAG